MPSLLGKLQVGLSGLFSFSLQMPFINQLKCGNAIQVIDDGVNYFASTPRGAPLSPWGVYLDDDGELINPLPDTVSHWTRIFYTQPQDGLPAGFSRTGQQWVLKWDGDPNLTIFAWSMSNIVKVGARATGTWTDNTSNKQITFSNFSNTDPPRNIRLCRADYEALMDAGELFSPDYVADSKRICGVARFMDWQATNNQRVGLSYAGLPTEAYCKWGGDSSIPGVNGVLPVSVISKFANRIHAHPWICIPGCFGIEKLSAVEGCTQANPCAITSSGHSFVNGDEVIPYRLGGMIKSATVTMTIASPCVVSWTGHGFAAGANVFFTGGTLPTGIIAGQSYYVISAGLTADAFQVSKTIGGAAVNTSGTQSGVHTGTAQLNRNKFTVANVVAGVSFELQGVDTSILSAWSGSGWLMSPSSLSNMTAQVMPFAAWFRDHVNAALISRFEWANEQWNLGLFDTGHQLFGQSHNFLDGSNDQVWGDNNNKMAGYFAAHCMKVIRDVYSVANRSRWKGIIATQTVNTGVTNDFIVGINRYIADQAPGLTINDLFDDGAITGYYGSDLLANGSALAVTIDIVTSTFTRSNHGFLDRRPVKFATSDTLPTPVVAGTLYYASNVTTNTFKIATTPGGTAITLGGSQAGTHTVTMAKRDWLLDTINTSISRFAGGLEPTRYKYYQRIINEDSLDGRWTGCPFSLDRVETVYYPPQKAIFDANDLSYTQYEGSLNWDLAALVSDPEYALFLEFFPEGTYCQESADLHTAMYENFLAIGGEFPSKFVDSAPWSRHGAFGCQNFTGEGGAQWESSCAFNDKLWCGRLR